MSDISLTRADRAASQGAAEAIVAGLLPWLKADLDRLIRIPSVAAPTRFDAPLFDAHDLVARLFRDAGVEVERLDLPDTAPIVVGHVAAPPGAPTVLLYSHYDVASASEDRDWDTAPFEPTERAGAIYGRGAADAKSMVMAHVGALRAWEGRPPVGIKICIEGGEESGSGALPDYLRRRADLFGADALIVGNMGNLTPGSPTLTTACRGAAEVVMEARTLSSGQHCGRYAGAAPDALLALLHAIASLHDEHGDLAVAGLRRTEWDGAEYSEREFRELAGVREGQPLLGRGALGSRIWSGPAITDIKLEAPPVDGGANAVAAYARALLGVRVHPEQDAARAQAAVIEHLRRQRPFGIEISVYPGLTVDGFRAGTTGPAYEAARTAWGEAWGADVRLAGCGASVPIVGALARALPDAETLLVGTSDSFANAHRPNERVLLDEFEMAIVAETKFFREFATRVAEAG